MSGTNRIDDYVTLVEQQELVGSFEAFSNAVRAATRRLEAEGIRELVNVQFFGAAGSKEIGIILTFSDRNRMLDHMKMIGGWEEFRAFASLTRPVEIRVFGKLPAEFEAWFRQIGAPLKKFEHLVVGFAR